ncbi:MAG: exodeoxyribonuclease VII large subunit [Anaerolineae bacterium]|jgi:exodeoxyribonuclease VII large subunit
MYLDLPGTAFLTVGQITAHLRSVLLRDDILQDIWVRGEVSGASLSRGGHLFFSLKDSDALIKGVVWAPLSYRLRSQLTDGQEVLVHGRVDLYPQQGVYQLYVDEAMPVGTGIAYLEFERVRAKLEAEGLFDQERKRPLPAFPRRIGVVTSAYGAARRDIENVLRQRWPSVEVVLAGSSVQGDGAPESLVAALHAVATQAVDVIILARGGGDKEALWCFNDERLARAIADMPVPVITGIGHETDFTIADFVADLRAPTPSAAAMAAVPDRREVLASVEDWERRLLDAVQDLVSGHRMQVSHLTRVLQRSSPAYVAGTWRQATEEMSGRLLRTGANLVPSRRAEVQSLARRLRACVPRTEPLRERQGLLAGKLHRAMENRLAHLRAQVDSLNASLVALDPEATLKRGYAIVHAGGFQGPVVSDATGLRPGDALAIRLAQGGALTKVERPLPEMQEEENEG